MRTSDYDRVCYLTEQRDERITLRNLRTGQIGYTFGCTHEGATVQVKLESGELDSWGMDECSEVTH